MSVFLSVDVELLGDSSSIAATTSLPIPPGTELLVSEGKTILRINGSYNPLGNESATAFAESILNALNGAARIFHPAHENLKCGQVVAVSPTGTQIIYASIAGRVEFRKAHSFSERARALSRASPSLMRAAISNREARKALRLWSGPHTFVRLNNILELVRGPVAKGRDAEAAWRRVAEMATLDDQDLRLLRTTANDARLAGDDARHAGTGPLPSEQMSLPDAEDLVRVVLVAWLERLGAQSA